MLLDESDIETENRKYIEQSTTAVMNLNVASVAIETLRMFAYESSFDTDDDVTILRLAIRVINDAGACGRCALAGYYQPAISQIRDIIEVSFLLDLFRRNPSKISEWRCASDRDRKNKFKPIALREELDRLDGKSDLARKEAYEFYSTHGTHVTPHLLVISPGLNTRIGPYPSKEMAIRITYDLAKWLCGGAGYALSCLDTKRVTDAARSLSLTKQKHLFATKWAAWRQSPQ
ncbi:hypothetical protein [Sinorhizobium meliloti]|uniref:hypothetical protein n=1 Tax=Rhizobium meliloti TaxID=382 RepID=UPI0020914743|nr:hypothetical protein [Sinorhizobium meliloti]MCO5962346.1 hypothetical protein [Sinorhizobium meliloti]